MALAVTVRMDFVDEKNKKSFSKLRVPTGFTISQYLEFAVAFAQLVATAVISRITNVSITFSISLAGLSLKSVAAAVADVAQKGYFSFATSTTGFYKRFRIPTFDESLIVAGSDAIDQVDSNVAAFVSAMENGIAVTGGTVTPTDERQHDITSLNDAREVFRRQR